MNRGVAGLLAVLLLTGCGSTVQARSTVAGPGGGLDQGLGAATGTGAGSTPVTGTGEGGAPSAGGTTGVGTGGGTSGGTSGSVTGATSGTGSSGTTGAAPAASPIKVGIVLTGTSNADSFGVSLGNTVTEQSVDQAVVDGLNAHGGLGGRKIVPVYAKTDTGSSNWETDFSAACATFTQDNKVEAVLGYVFNYFASFESCLARKGIPHLNTGFNIPDNKELSAFPLHEALDVPTIGRRSLAKLEGGVADGILTPASKIGVLRDTCPGTGRSYDEVFLPAVKRLGLTVKKDIQITCGNGNSDSGAAVQAVQSAVLQFASAGVDQVIFHAASEGPALLLFSLSAESQTYRPGYLVTSLANLEALRGYFPAEQKPHIHGYGWLPTQDVPPSAYPKQNAAQTRCLALVRAKGVTPAAGPDFYYAYNICEAFFVYERALVAAGTSSGVAVMAAVKQLGTSVTSATNEGGSSYNPSYPDAPRAARHLVYTPGCSCFAYTGPTRAIPNT